MLNGQINVNTVKGDDEQVVKTIGSYIMPVNNVCKFDIHAYPLLVHLNAMQTKKKVCVLSTEIK